MQLSVMQKRYETHPEDWRLDPLEANPLLFLSANRRVRRDPLTSLGTVLVADDDPASLDVLTYVLERAGYHVLAARDGREAVELYKTNHRLIVLTILDLSMPTLDGDQTFRELRHIRPDVLAVLTGSEGCLTVVRNLSRQGLAGFIAKPFRPSVLLGTVWDVLNEAKARGVLTQGHDGHWRHACPCEHSMHQPP